MARLTLTLGIVCGLGLGMTAESTDPPARTDSVGSALAERAEIAEEQAASRSARRPTRPTNPPQPSPTAAPNRSTGRAHARTHKPVKRPKPRPARPAPVAGLTRAQMDNAYTIVQVGRKMGVPRRGLVIAVATAMQESNLYNLASAVLPESLNYPHQGVGSDHDSVGLFQQRPSSGWGAVADLMRPSYAAQRFFEALLQVPGWQSLSLTVAAQAVQVSAFPDAYAQHEQRATTVVSAILA